MIFVDSNIPMYLIGAAHPRKAETQILLERLIAAGQRLVTDAEVLQEILHRYTLLKSAKPSDQRCKLPWTSSTKCSPSRKRRSCALGRSPRIVHCCRPATPFTLRL